MGREDPMYDERCNAILSHSFDRIPLVTWMCLVSRLPQERRNRADCQRPPMTDPTPPAPMRTDDLRPR